MNTGTPFENSFDVPSILHHPSSIIHHPCRSMNKYAVYPNSLLDTEYLIWYSVYDISNDILLGIIHIPILKSKSNIQKSNLHEAFFLIAVVCWLLWQKMGSRIYLASPTMCCRYEYEIRDMRYEIRVLVCDRVTIYNELWEPWEPWDGAKVRRGMNQWNNGIANTEYGVRSSK